VTGGSGNAAQLLAARLCVVGSWTAINADGLGVLRPSTRLRSGTVLPPGKSPDDARTAKRDGLTGRVAVPAVAVLTRL